LWVEKLWPASALRGQHSTLFAAAIHAQKTADQSLECQAIVFAAANSQLLISAQALSLLARL
jgi:hypothetical protein